MAYDPLLSHTLAQLGVGLSHAGEAIANAITAKGEYQTRGLEAQLAANLQREAMGLQKYLAQLDDARKRKEIDNRKAAFDAYMAFREKYAKEAMKLLQAMNSGDNAQAQLSGTIMNVLSNAIKKMEDARDPKTAFERLKAIADYAASKENAEEIVYNRKTKPIPESPPGAIGGSGGETDMPFYSKAAQWAKETTDRFTDWVDKALWKAGMKSKGDKAAILEEAARQAAERNPAQAAAVYDVATPELAQTLGFGSALFQPQQAYIAPEMMALPILLQLAQIAGRSNAAGEAARYSILGGMLNPGPFTY